MPIKTFIPVLLIACIAGLPSCGGSPADGSARLGDDLWEEDAVGEDTICVPDCEGLCQIDDGCGGTCGCPEGEPKQTCCDHQCSFKTEAECIPTLDITYKVAMGTDDAEAHEDACYLGFDPYASCTSFYPYTVTVLTAQFVGPEDLVCAVDLAKASQGKASIMICKSREGLLTPFPGSFTPDKKGHLIEVTVPRVELNAGNYTVGVTCESGSQISSSTTVTIKVKCGGFEDELSWPLRDCNSGWQAFGVDIMSNGGCYITPLNEVTEDLVPRS